MIAGHSLGAYIAARLATLHPDRVESLVLVDGGLTIPGSADVDPEEFMRGVPRTDAGAPGDDVRRPRRVRRLVG